MSMKRIDTRASRVDGEELEEALPGSPGKEAKKEELHPAKGQPDIPPVPYSKLFRYVVLWWWCRQVDEDSKEQQGR